ncbi:copper resistance protein CopC [Paenibacillus sp. GYB004]|uniref:copper resistance CopC family protein n=1 Tax=Paenibacillus sp. GYB004 TaxID=2994393 RepID=UPI002F9678DE
MLKKTFALLFVSVLLFLSPISVQAHTGLKTSSPAGGETLDKSVTEIKMEFNTDIEPLSNFNVQNNKGETIKVNDIKIEKNLMSGKVDALPNGDYTVGWKIVGRDGHPIENKFTFSINKIEPDAKTSEPQATGNSSSIGSSASDTKPANPASKNEATEITPAVTSNEEGANGKYLMPIILVVLFVSAFVILILVRAFKGKKG